MFKSLVCYLVVAVVAVYGQVNSGSSNTGMNVNSIDSIVSQNDIQNAQAFNGFGYYPYPYVPQSGYVGLPGYVAYQPLYGFDPAYYPYAGLGGYGYGLGHFGRVNSASSNMGANIMSSNSVVAQDDVQNAVDAV